MSPDKDIRYSRSYTFAQGMHADMDRVGDERFKGNRSAAAQHYIRLGQLAEKAGFCPDEMSEEQPPEAVGQ